MDVDWPADCELAVLQPSMEGDRHVDFELVVIG
jgi:hypothetical protein